MTKEKPKFIKMYDPETGEYIGPFVNMTHEEAHGKKPESPFEFKFDKEAANTITEIFSPFLEDCAKEIENATKNSAEIFCRITDCTYDTFANYAEKYASSIPALLPNIVKSSIATISCVADLSEIILNVPMLVYALYYERYNNSILPSSQMDIVFDIVSAMLELKKEGMIQ
jgi:hypothetical protein|uniref:Uncharacterized protein n=1 Tax=Siphoviridae sp. ct0yq10 TaxID=2826270 RepID=A0A8S5MNU8_9CAUD|nr:MAG TPA: hypothetical protein [Siphoviridae sp. ct0yq10]